MTLEVLEKANEIVEEANAIDDLQVLLRNASMQNAEVRACRGSEVLNRCTLWPEITEKLLEVLQSEKVKLNAKFEAL